MNDAVQVHPKRAPNSGTDWVGDLDDDCVLNRYGYTAHVECMDRHRWWFSVGRGEWPDYIELYNTAEECVIELLNKIEVTAFV